MFQCSPRQLTLDISLQADGQYSAQGQSNSFYSTATSMLHVRSSGMQSSASVGGSVLIDGVPILESAFSSSGTIARTRSGQVTMYHFN